MKWFLGTLATHTMGPASFYVHKYSVTSVFVILCVILCIAGNNGHESNSAYCLYKNKWEEILKEGSVCRNNGQLPTVDWDV